MHGDPAVRKSTCQLIAKFAEMEPLRGLNFLTLLLHQLGREQVENLLKILICLGSRSPVIDPLHFPCSCQKSCMRYSCFESASPNSRNFNNEARGY